MENQVTNNVQISALSYEIGKGGISNEAHILPPGKFSPDDGRPMLVEAYVLDQKIASHVITRMTARKNDSLIDYEHQSLRAAENGKPVIAAGWFKTMEYRETGLWATNISWTEQAKSYIQAKEYRYISAVFAYDTATGEVYDVLSITLTNTPALDGLQSLAALTKKINQEDLNQGVNTMSEKDVTALTAELSDSQTKVIALTQDLAAVTTKVTSLTADLAAANEKLAAADKEKAEAALTAEKKAHADLLQTALSDGRVAPAQKAWAEKLPLAALTEYLDASAPLVDGKKQSTGSDQPEHGLSETELAMCSSMRVKPEDYVKIKTADTAARKLAQG